MSETKLVPYPDPISEAIVDRIIEQRIEMGWTYNSWNAERQQLARHNLRIRLRLQTWLTVGLGLTRAPRTESPKGHRL
jgi:hypothetical protein